MVFHESLTGVLMKFQGCFKTASRVIHQIFKGVSRKFQGCLKESHNKFQEFSRHFKGCFEKEFQACFKVVSENFQGGVKKVLREI